MGKVFKEQKCFSYVSCCVVYFFAAFSHNFCEDFWRNHDIHKHAIIYLGKKDNEVEIWLFRKRALRNINEKKINSRL